VREREILGPNTRGLKRGGKGHRFPPSTHNPIEEGAKEEEEEEEAESGLLLLLLLLLGFYKYTKGYSQDN